MNIFITGANGFIGQYLVYEALDKGHYVKALVHSNLPQKWGNLSRLDVIKADLLCPEDFTPKIRGSDIVIHAAASMSGNDKNRYSNTLSSTRNLLEALSRHNVSRLIGLSSISVLDYIDLSPLDVVDEQTPVNENDASLGSYALMKRDQERLMEEWGQRDSNRLAIIRPGLVYDERNISNSHIGFVRKRFSLAALHYGEVPLVYARSVAEALVSLANTDFEDEVLHLVNDQLPTQSEYIETIESRKRLGTDSSWFLSVSWKTYSMISRVVSLLLTSVGKSHRIPDSFRDNSVAGRLKPLKFSNSRAKKRLNWSPEKGLYLNTGV